MGEQSQVVAVMIRTSFCQCGNRTTFAGECVNSGVESLAAFPRNVDWTTCQSLTPYSPIHFIMRSMTAALRGMKQRFRFDVIEFSKLLDPPTCCVGSKRHGEAKTS